MAFSSAWVLVPPLVWIISVVSDESDDSCKVFTEADTDELSDVVDSNEVEDKSCWSTTANSLKNVYKKYNK